MFFAPFNAHTTNLYPAANTLNGGQLNTEYNIRSRDSVSVNPNVKYFLAPSYVHAIDEFSLVYDKTRGNSILILTPGKAVVNGHYVESLVPIEIDIAEGNSHEVDNGGLPIEGDLSVGLKMMYSNNTTLVGTTDKDGNYLGVQVVVAKTRDFHLPGSNEDTCKDEWAPTAHLLLGTFTYDERGIVASSIIQNEDKIRYIDTRRLLNIDEELGGRYFSKDGLAPNRMYTVATKVSENYVSAEFCDSTDSLIRWDGTPMTFEASDYRREELMQRCKDNPTSRFLTMPDKSGAYLHLPHKQPDNNSTAQVKMTDYRPVELQLPVAELSSGRPGIVNFRYSKEINKVVNKMNEFYRLPNGKQLKFIKNLDDRADLPKIPNSYHYGDYIIVKEDSTLNDDGQLLESAYSWPSTMYIVLPGVITNITPVASPNQYGMRIAEIVSTEEPSNDPKVYLDYWDFEGMEFRGEVGVDYFVYNYEHLNDDDETVTDVKYYQVSEIKPTASWSEPVIVTAQIPLATEELIGGFVNIQDDSSNLDKGYVGLDGEGHLVMFDYQLLRSGTLAYQIGQDQEFSGMDLETLQVELDERVNERIAFPNVIANKEFSHIINITIELPDTEEGGVVEIRGVDSRFNTCIYVHILGDAGPNVTLRFIDCQKLMIDNAMRGEPTIELYRCHLYYDAFVINHISTIRNMTLWYEKFSEDDADIIVDGMTVRETKAAIPTEDIDYWSEDNSNDNHYQYALESLTFDNEGNIVGLGLYMRDMTTRDNVPTGKHVITCGFTLPQGSRLLYPASKFTRPIKVSGSFISGYIPSNMSTFKIYIADINFTVITDVYDSMKSKSLISGRMTIVDDCYVTNSIGGDGYASDGINVDMPGINTTEFHSFLGGVIG